MASFFRWIAASDSPPPSASTTNSHRSVVTIRKEKDRALPVSRRSTDPDTVTYASKDDRRNIQFVAHLPAGSHHAGQAQQIAGSIFTGRPGETGKKMLKADRNDRKLLEDEGIQTRRVRVEQERRKPGRDVEEADIITIRPDPHRELERERERDRQRPWIEDEVEEVSTVRGDFDDVMSTTSAPSRASVSSSIMRKDKPPEAGFRHQSASHITYNITDKDGRRQLFVSAPVGSREADTHDYVAAKAANSVPSARIQDKDRDFDSGGRQTRRYVTYER